MTRLKGLYILDAPSVELIYGTEEQRDVAKRVDIYESPQTGTSIKSNPRILNEADVIFSGWGAPVMDSEFLAAAPRLRAVFYGSGSIRPFTTEAFWERNIVVTSAYAANAVPVAEYTLGVILLSLKQFWSYAANAKNGLGWGDHTRPMLGAFRSTVGIISCGMIARKTLELLASFDVERLVACPFLSDEDARKLGVTRCSLPEIFRRADVVSLHTPMLPETIGMITGRHFKSMKPGATFINTSRGRVVRQEEMIEVLAERPDITVVLDVVYPEPPEAGSPLFSMPNVVLTPHIAGSMGNEIKRLGRFMVEELRRFVEGKPLKWQITREQAEKLA